MVLVIRISFLSLLLAGVAANSVAQSKKLAPITAVVECTQASAKGQIRQFVFDGNKETYFATEKNASAKDNFTLTFEKPVKVKTLEVLTGKPKGEDALKEANLEISEDGKTFQTVGKFQEGQATRKLDGKTVLAIRIQPTEDLKYPLTIREIVVDSEPAVRHFKYPVEFTIDVSDAPEMKEWTEKVARICERQYTMINEELKSEGFKPARSIRLTMKNDYDGVAYASGSRIVGSVKFFKSHPEDMGAFVHETVHVVQQYRTRGNPGWLVEGIADYIRFFKYEPGKAGRLNAERARYNGSYRTTAAFLNYLSEKYDPLIVQKLNKMLREGEYKEEAFQVLTKKTVQELDEEWRASLKK
ncbi:discoidin domain-containing protein [Telmatocola sphagniphila]|uniref:Discoidin domain-containing protein n=2 Tax=Telmatocola sphagniphila TaxID=1123043 RepID=A0A8E6BC24_9BACT|nr:discoidin domain-containing protein [Telmatocola sphagniphila]